jgi:hypothetical protein
MSKTIALLRNSHAPIWFGSLGVLLALVIGSHDAIQFRKNAEHRISEWAQTAVLADQRLKAGPFEVVSRMAGFTGASFDLYVATTSQPGTHARDYEVFMTFAAQPEMPVLMLKHKRYWRRLADAPLKARDISLSDDSKLTVVYDYPPLPAMVLAAFIGGPYGLPALALIGSLALAACWWLLLRRHRRGFTILSRRSRSSPAG